MADGGENNENANVPPRTNDQAYTPASNVNMNIDEMGREQANTANQTTPQDLALEIEPEITPQAQATQITPQDMTTQITPQTDTFPDVTQIGAGLDNTIASLEQVIKDVKLPAQQEIMDIDIDSETDKLLNSSQESLQTGLQNVLDSMKINDDTPDENPEEDSATRRSLRIKIRREPASQEYEKITAKKNAPAQQVSESNETNEKTKTTKKKKKKQVKRQSTELEEIAELKKIIKINDELIEEDDIRIKKLEEELDNTLNRLDNVNGDNTKLIQENEKLTQINKQLEEEASNQQEVIRTLKNELENVNYKTNEKQQAQIQELDNITREQEKTINNLKEELDDTKNRFTQLEGLLETMRHRNNLQERRIAQLKRTLSSDDEKETPTKRSRQTQEQEPRRYRDTTAREHTEHPRKIESQKDA